MIPTLAGDVVVQRAFGGENLWAVGAVLNDGDQAAPDPHICTSRAEADEHVRRLLQPGRQAYQREPDGGWVVWT